MTTKELAVATSTVWVLLAAILVMFMQAGFAFLEAGLTRMKNVGHIAAKNVLVLALASVVYYLVGFGIAFGDGGNALVGGSGFLPSSETLLAVASIVAQPLPIQEVMRRVAREVGRAFGADTVGMYFLDASRRSLVPMAGYHVPKHLLSAFVDTPFPIELLGEAFTERAPVWTSDFVSDARFDFPFMAAIHPGAVLFAPTLVRGEAVGGVFLVWWRPGRVFDPAEVRLIEGVASQVGLAVENAELEQRAPDDRRNGRRDAEDHGHLAHEPLRVVAV